MPLTHTCTVHAGASSAGAPASVGAALQTGGQRWYDRLGLLLESTGEGIFGIDLQGHCVFINRAGARMLGYEPSEVLGRNMHELTHHTHPDGRAYAVEHCPIFNAFRQGLPCRIDSELFWHRDGSGFAVEYSSYPILDGELVLGAVITFVDITERRRAADALQRAKQELQLRVHERTVELADALKRTRELAAYSEAVREEERTRIAREVHDELGSLLVALKMDVNWVDKRLAEQDQRSEHEAQAMRARLRSKCRDMSRLIENAVDNVGRIITDLRPSILDHQGLWAAIEWQAREFVRSAEMRLDLQMHVDEALELPEPQTIAVFRIFQEMLSNVGRHARATCVRIEVGVYEGQLRLQLSDDGRGADHAAFEATDAYGVMGMRERARHFGGALEICSAPGQGCRLTLRMPLGVLAAGPGL
jgi:PAS domain S-box-containing protein